MRPFWGLILLVVPGLALADAPKPPEHVCAASEGTAPCPLGRVRMCTKEGALAACTCPPGTKETKAACAVEGADKPVACVVPDATIADRLGVVLELLSLELPQLPTLEVYGAADALAVKESTATDVELLRAAEASDSVEGASAFLANDASGPKRKAKLAARDQAVARGINLRTAFVTRFGKHPRLDEQRVALARGHLRRAAYTVVGAGVESDRKIARALLEAVVVSGTVNGGGKAPRDAAFMLGEQAVRDRDFTLCAAHEERVLAWARPKLVADDHAFLAAASARLAQARLAAGDLTRALPALTDAIEIGVTCSPRAECVMAASASRKVIASAWAAASTAPRATFALLSRGSMPRHERVRPLVVLADLYAHGAGKGCSAAAEEARAFEQLL